MTLLQYKLISFFFILQQKVCPMCGNRVIKLPRHMRNVHGMSVTESRKIVNKTNQRKPYTMTQEQLHKLRTKRGEISKPKIVNCNIPQQRNYAMRICPIEGCGRYVKRLTDHIKYMHKKNLKQISNSFINLSTNSNHHEFIPEEQSTNFEDDVPELIKARARRCALPYANEMRKPPIVIPEGCFYYSETIENFSVIKSMVIEEYEKYCRSCDAGYRSERATKQMSGKISEFMETLCDNTSFENLFSVEKFRDMFTEKIVSKKWKASSGCTYRQYMLDFLLFLDISKKIIVPQIAVQDLKGALKRWSKGNYQLFKVQTYQKRKETESLLLKPEEIEEIYKTQLFRDAVKLFGFAEEDAEISRSQFCIMRNYLLLNVYLKQGLRTGVCANLTVKEYHCRVYDPNTKLTSLEVTEHKTTGAYGDAIILLSEDVAKYFDIFFTQVRPVASAAALSPCDYFFVNWSGNAMNSSEINSACKSAFKSMGLTNMYVSLIRKSLVTTVHELGDEEDMKILSIGMDHDVNTAKMHYAHRNKLQAVKEAYSKIENISKSAVEAKGKFYYDSLFHVQCLLKDISLDVSSNKGRAGIEKHGNSVEWAHQEQAKFLDYNSQ